MVGRAGPATRTIVRGRSPNPTQTGPPPYWRSSPIPPHPRGLRPARTASTPRDASPAPTPSPPAAPPPPPAARLRPRLAARHHEVREHDLGAGADHAAVALEL